LNRILRAIWTGYKPYELKNGCNPAIIVNIETEKAGLNRRCTGLIDLVILILLTGFKDFSPIY